jgi:uncharacterized repeat protein (TIGR03803 family)
MREAFDDGGNGLIARGVFARPGWCESAAAGPLKWRFWARSRRNVPSTVEFTERGTSIMARRDMSRHALTGCVAAALLAGCGGSQAPIATPGSMPQALAPAVRTTSGNYRVVYSFGAAPDGSNPVASLIEVSGTLYGTTAGGGSYSCGTYYYGCGTVFGVAKNGTEKVLYAFNGGSEGGSPLAGLVDVNGTLYGTASSGGTHDYGTVYGVTPSGMEKVLRDFSGRRDGGVPTGSLIDVSGKLYGTTRRGGAHEVRSAKGTVFAITTGGTERVLHRFRGTPDGEAPYANLVDVGGKLYGTTAFGGAHGDGTVFSVTRRGAEKVIYSFRGSPDGELPAGGLVDVGGTLYGTTAAGGAYTSCSHGGCGSVVCTGGCGTVYSISPSGNEQVLHSFGSGADGIDPNGSLIAVKGTIYGTTSEGGSDTCSFGCGTVFSIATSGAENVMYNFGTYPDGNTPRGGLLAVRGTLYGTTTFGGTYGNGTVFALRP